MKHLLNIIRSHIKAAFMCFPQPLQSYIRNILRILLNDENLSSKQKKCIYADLNMRLKSGPKPSVWFLPTLTWFCNAFQRPQQMARALADVGCNVFYYEPWTYDNKFMISKDGLKDREFVGVRDLETNLHLFRCPEDIFVEFLCKCQPDVLIMIWPYQAGYIKPEVTGFVVYEMIDDHSLDNADIAWHEIHNEWIHKSDILIATADDLLGQLQKERNDILLLPNGVYPGDWVLPESSPLPEDMHLARQAPVVVGYYGAIADWFDWTIWEFAAKTKPNWSFVLIGPPYDGDFNKINERIKKFPNMFYLGSKPYNNLANYLAQFDVAIIPFTLNKITHACSPIKLFEFMAGGKPIVATPMREILKYKSVLIAETPEAFVNQLENALIKKNDPEYRLTLKQEAEANTWRSRAEALRQAIESVRFRQNNIPKRHMIGNLQDKKK